MKKIISLSILFIFFFSFLILTPIKAESDSSTSEAALTSELEKIPNPDQIKNFKVMKKEGNTLFGIRLEKLEAVQAKIKEAVKTNAQAQANVPTMTSSGVSATTRSSQGTLEKIPAPVHIKFYEKIRQVGNALWGIKKQVEAKAITITADISACVATTINTKDQSLMTEVSATANSLNAAISTRSDCQQAAIKSPENQKDNLNVCVKAFQTRHREINTNGKAKHKEIWNTYRVGLKECLKSRIATTTSDATEEEDIIIEDGGETVLDTAADTSTE